MPFSEQRRTATDETVIYRKNAENLRVNPSSETGALYLFGAGMLSN